MIARQAGRLVCCGPRARRPEAKRCATCNPAASALSNVLSRTSTGCIRTLRRYFGLARCDFLGENTARDSLHNRLIDAHLPVARRRRSVAEPLSRNFAETPRALQRSISPASGPWTGAIDNPTAGLPNNAEPSDQSHSDSERSNSQDGAELGCSLKPSRYVTLRFTPSRTLSGLPLARQVLRSGQ